MNTQKSTHTEKIIQCGHCGCNSVMLILSEKREVEIMYSNNEPISSLWVEWQILKCPDCEKINVLENYAFADENECWYDKDGNEHDEEVVHSKALYPLADSDISQPNEHMPLDVRQEYEEARKVFPISAKSSAALLRLAIQRICIHLGEKGRHLDTDIASLVKKGLPKHIQKALDIVRVIGNEAVHPGAIDITDKPETARSLFVLVNEIVENQINKQDIKAEIDDAYKKLPKSKLKHIEKRDKK